MSEGECEFCGEPSQYEETVWGVLEWCGDCEEEAAWHLYSDLAQTTDRYWVEMSQAQDDKKKNGDEEDE